MNVIFLVIGVDIVTAESIYGFEPTQLNRYNIDSYTTERVVLPDTSTFIHSPIPIPYNGKLSKNKKLSSPTVSFPKYNNYVKNKNKFDKFTRVLLPLDLLGITNNNVQGKVSTFLFFTFPLSGSSLFRSKTCRSYRKSGFEPRISSSVLLPTIFPKYFKSNAAENG